VLKSTHLLPKHTVWGTYVRKNKTRKGENPDNLTWLEREGWISCVMNSVVLRLRESERASQKSLASSLAAERVLFSVQA
jgi:hypothetical protein